MSLALNATAFIRDKRTVDTRLHDLKPITYYIGLSQNPMS